MVIRPMGDRALLAEVESLDDVLRLHAAGWRQPAVPEGSSTSCPPRGRVLVTVDPRVLPLAAARAWIAPYAGASRGARRRRGRRGGRARHRLRRSGPRRHRRELLGLTADELVRRHSTARVARRVHGLRPGFGYLVSGDWPFDVPRLDRAAHPRAGRSGRPGGGEIHRRLSARDPGRMAAHRNDRRARCGIRMPLLPRC